MIPQPFEDLIQGMVIVGAISEKQATELRGYLVRAIEREIAREVTYRKRARGRVPWWRRWLEW